MEREIIITGNTDSERQTVLGFLSFIDASFESLDMCILLGMPTDIRKLVKIHEKLKRREGEDGRQWCGAKATLMTRRGLSGWGKRRVK